MRYEIQFFPAISLIVAGASRTQWGGFARLALLLIILAGLIAAGVVTVRSRYVNRITRRRVAGQEVSASLVTLSSAAILAVYAAGYHRTGSAEDKFVGQTARRRTGVPVAANLAPTQPVSASGEAPRSIAAAPTVPLKQASQKSAPAVPGANPAPELTERPSAMPAPAPTPIGPSIPVSPISEPTPNRPSPSSVAQQPIESNRKYKYKDGTFTGWGTSRHGDIQASVVIQSGQILLATITSCLTRYPCSVIADLPGEVASRQTADVDIISDASESSYAFSDAVADALSKASQ